MSNETTITEIIQFPSKRFETVNFGYGNLCIIAGNKGPNSGADQAKWSDAKKSDAPLRLELFEKSEIVSNSFFRTAIKDGWIHPSTKKAIRLPKKAVALGEIAECRTGIYTGDNGRFCAYDANNPPKRANGHSIDWSKQLRAEPLNADERERGLAGKRCYVPFVRGGHRSPFEQTRHAINWSVDAVSYYGTDKKARLQNHTFYFRSGLAIPMVTSGRLSASLMERAIFDQGVVGVFPHDERMLSFLLLYLNSQCVTNYKKMISPSANNSANYIKKLPVPTVSTCTLEEAHRIGESAD